MTVSSRPSTDGREWLLYGKQFCDMEFICAPIAVLQTSLEGLYTTVALWLVLVKLRGRQWLLRDALEARVDW